MPVEPKSQPRAHHAPTKLDYVATTPFLYGALLAMVPLDLYLRLYQAACFRAWGIPLVHRADHFLYDRARLPYLTRRQRFHCLYCSYANGLASYFTEILGRTEQFWCPIRHAKTPPHPHSRYKKFIAHNDAQTFHQIGDQTACDFTDVEK